MVSSFLLGSSDGGGEHVSLLAKEFVNGGFLFFTTSQFGENFKLEWVACLTEALVLPPHRFSPVRFLRRLRRHISSRPLPIDGGGRRTCDRTGNYAMLKADHFGAPHGAMLVLSTAQDGTSWAVSFLGAFVRPDIV
jgi:hypothetical protein